MRKQGYVSIGYIDDSFLKGEDLAECQNNVIATVETFAKLGFVIHPTKSVFHPSQSIQFLGFTLNSNKMTVSLPTEKSNHIKATCKRVLEHNMLTIQEVASLIGLMVASFPGVERGPLYYRQLENEKTQRMSLSPLAISNIQWWAANVTTAERLIPRDPCIHYRE